MITYNADRGRYEWRGTFENRHKPRDAGWSWDVAGKVWFTPSHLRAYVLHALYGERGQETHAFLYERELANESSDTGRDAPEFDWSPPSGLALRPFQVAGALSCLDRIYSRGAALLADEMGVGKTPQALAVAYEVEVRVRVLVVCPATLRENWRQEVERWLPADQANLVDIVSYEGAVTIFSALEKGKRPKLKGFEDRNPDSWGLVIYDEAHYLKSMTSQRTKVLLGKPAKDGTWKPAKGIGSRTRRLFLTGTPLLNRPIELFPILAACGLADENGVGNRWDFSRRYCKGHEERIPGCGGTRWVEDGADNMEELQLLMRSTIMVRRMKAEVLDQLPSKLVQAISLFRAKRSDLEDYLVAEVEAKGVDAVLATLTPGTSAFDEIAALRKEQGLQKVDAAVSFIMDKAESGPVLVFAHHREVLEQLQAKLSMLVDTGLLYGGMSAEAKQKAVTDFKTGKTRALCLSIRAGGVGLNLTEAACVVFVEADWTPALNSQCEDRSHRNGQDVPVTVYYLLADGSLDAAIMKKNIEKQSIFDSAMNTPTKKG